MSGTTTNRGNDLKRYMSAGAIAVTIGLGLVACAAGGTPSETATQQTSTVVPTPTPTVEPAVEHIGEKWTFDYEGATASFQIPTPGEDPLAQQLEAIRAEVGGQPATYVTVAVDNTAGTSNINMYGMTVVALDGTQTVSTPVSDIIGEWRDLTEDTDLYNRLIDLSNEVGMFDLRPGATGTAVIAFREPVASVAAVFVQPAGGADEMAASPE